MMIGNGKGNDADDAGNPWFFDNDILLEDDCGEVNEVYKDRQEQDEENDKDEQGVEDENKPDDDVEDEQGVEDTDEVQDAAEAQDEDITEAREERPAFG
jgi:hypothetical protein